MKKIAFLVVCFLATFTTFAQEEIEGKEKKEKKVSEYEYFPKKHIVKINPASFSFGKLSLGYEHVLEKNKSLAVQVGIPTGISVPKTLSDEISNDITVNTSDLKGLSIRPSYRMYLSSKKRGPKGLYFEPSLKYQKFDLDADAIYKNKGTDYDVKMDASVSTFGAGLQLGSQWVISDAVAIDFFFLGPEVNFGTATLNVKDDGAIPSASRKDLEKDIESIENDLSFIGDVNVTTDADTIKAETKGSTIPGFRFGIQFGYSF